MGRGFYWFKCDLGLLDDPAVAALTEEFGAEGLGVWVAALVVMYSEARAGAPWVPVERLVRKVASGVNITKNRSRKVLFLAKNLGLFDAEMWAEGKAANEHVAERYIEYLRQCERAATARANRAASNFRAEDKGESKE